MVVLRFLVCLMGGIPAQVSALSKGDKANMYYSFDHLSFVRADEEGNVVETWNNSLGEWVEVVAPAPEGVSQEAWNSANAAWKGEGFVQFYNNVIVGGKPNGERTHKWNGNEWVELGLIDPLRIGVEK